MKFHLLNTFNEAFAYKTGPIYSQFTTFPLETENLAAGLKNFTSGGFLFKPLVEIRAIRTRGDTLLPSYVDMCRKYQSGFTQQVSSPLELFRLELTHGKLSSEKFRWLRCTGTFDPDKLTTDVWKPQSI